MIYGHIGNSGNIKNIELGYFDKRKKLEKLGFVFYKSLKAGSSSSFTFRKQKEVCAIGFDSFSEAVNHVYDRINNNKNPFMIF